jgi:hypothetical protein
MNKVDNEGRKILEGDVFVVPNHVESVTEIVKNSGAVKVEDDCSIPLYDVRGIKSYDASVFSDKDSVMRFVTDDIAMDHEIRHLDRVRISWGAHTDKHGDEIPASDGVIELFNHWVQIWATDPKDENGIETEDYCENWNDHHWSFSKKFEEGENHRFVRYLPAALFAGKKEGDVVEFYLDNVCYRLTCRQTAYRYARFGKFEDALAHVGCAISK